MSADPDALQPGEISRVQIAPGRWLVTSSGGSYVVEAEYANLNLPVLSCPNDATPLSFDRVTLFVNSKAEQALFVCPNGDYKEIAPVSVKE